MVPVCEPAPSTSKADSSQRPGTGGTGDPKRPGHRLYAHVEGQPLEARGVDLAVIEPQRVPHLVPDGIADEFRAIAGQAPAVDDAPARSDAPLQQQVGGHGRATDAQGALIDEGKASVFHGLPLLESLPDPLCRPVMPPSSEHSWINTIGDRLSRRPGDPLAGETYGDRATCPGGGQVT